MDLNREPRTIANAAAEEVRDLNHVTMDPKSMPYPIDIAGAAIGVNALLQRLPQSLEQLGTTLQRMEEAEEIRMQDGSSSQEPVSRVLRALLNAREGIAVAQSAMHTAVNELGQMGAHFNSDDEDLEEDALV